MKTNYERDARVSYLRQVALNAIVHLFPGMHPNQMRVTQIGKDGFFFKLDCDTIPRARVNWVDRIKKANEGFF